LLHVADLVENDDRVQHVCIGTQTLCRCLARCLGTRQLAQRCLRVTLLPALEHATGSFHLQHPAIRAAECLLLDLRASQRSRGNNQVCVTFPDQLAGCSYPKQPCGGLVRVTNFAGRLHDDAVR
jgi:hypothetical protein